MTTNYYDLDGAVEQGSGGWWIAQAHEDFIDEAILRDATNAEAIARWDGVVGRYRTEQEAWEALEQWLSQESADAE